MLEEEYHTIRSPLLDTLSLWTRQARKHLFGKRQNLLVKGIPREYNIIAQKQQINSASYARIFEIKTIVEIDNGP